MIRIYNMQSEHLDDVFSLEQICFPNDFWTCKMFEEELENNISAFFVAVDTDINAVVGYAGVWFMADVANITNVATAPEYRCMGIGRMLVDALINASAEKDMSSITLEVRDSNLSAQRLYEKSGFERVGVRKRYYKDREDAILMTKIL